VRARLRKLRLELWFARQLVGLPPRVARFQWRAWRLAARRGDEFSRVSATRPRKLAALLEVSAARRRIVELGTATGWTAISLALADPERIVVTYDLADRPERELYLGLVAAAVRERVRFVCAAGGDGPKPEWPVELLYIDSSHAREETLRELASWTPALAAEAVVVLDDFGHPEYPGVREAVEELGLEGEARGGLFVHRASAARAPGTPGALPP
jgi:predicted O-methyltransferase YrrM